MNAQPFRCGLVPGDPARIARAVADAQFLAGEPGTPERAAGVERLLPLLPTWRAKVAERAELLAQDGIRVELPRCADAAEEYVEAVRLLFTWHRPAANDDEVALHGVPLERLAEEAELARQHREACAAERTTDAVALRMGLIDGTGRLLVDEHGAPLAGALPFARQPLPPGVDWSRERIEDEYQRHWDPLERAMYREWVETYKPHETRPLEAAQAAAGKVLSRRRRVGMAGVVGTEVAA